MASSSLDLQEEEMRKDETSDAVSSEKLENLIQAADGEDNFQGSSPAPELEESGLNNSDLTEKQTERSLIWKIIKIDPEKEITSSNKTKLLGKRKVRSDEGEELPYEDVGSTSRRNTMSKCVKYQVRSIRTKRYLPLESFYTKWENEKVEMEFINGHAVKANLAPTVRFILAKYGDIAFSTWSNYYHDFCGTLLEMVAEVVVKIVSNDFRYILSELDSLKTMADVATMAELNVAWLHKELAEIEKVRTLVVNAAMRDFDTKEKIMMKARKQVKEVQRCLDHAWWDYASAAMP